MSNINIGINFKKKVIIRIIQPSGIKKVVNIKL